MVEGQQRETGDVWNELILRYLHYLPKLSRLPDPWIQASEQVPVPEVALRRDCVTLSRFLEADRLTIEPSTSCSLPSREHLVPRHFASL